MTTCRDIIKSALGALGVIGVGGDPTADELDCGLAAMEGVISTLHGARGPLAELDVTADYIASEDQRIRVQLGSTVTVTLPNSIACGLGALSGDYGFSHLLTSEVESGTGASADGRHIRAPRDGSRIEIVGFTRGLYFYRADNNAWVLADPLTIDGPSPLNARYDGALSALVAERLCDTMSVAPSAVLAKRIARGNAALLMEPGAARRRITPAFL